MVVGEKKRKEQQKEKKEKKKKKKREKPFGLFLNFWQHYLGSEGDGLCNQVGEPL